METQRNELDGLSGRTPVLQTRNESSDEKENVLKVDGTLERDTDKNDPVFILSLSMYVPTDDLTT